MDPTRHYVSQFIYINKMLYMFQAVPPPIIRSSNCTYSFWYLSHLGMELSSIPTMIAAGSSIVWQIPEAVRNVLCDTISRCELVVYEKFTRRLLVQSHYVKKYVRYLVGNNTSHSSSVVNTLCVMITHEKIVTKCLTDCRTKCVLVDFRAYVICWEQHLNSSTVVIILGEMISYE
jgi:hypothetical protein